MDTTEKVLAQLQQTTEQLRELQHPEQVKLLIRETQQRRDRLLLEGMELGVSERRLALTGGVNRSWLWRLKSRGVSYG